MCVQSCMYKAVYLSIKRNNLVSNSALVYKLKDTHKANNMR